MVDETMVKWPWNHTSLRIAHDDTQHNSWKQQDICVGVDYKHDFTYSLRDVLQHKMLSRSAVVLRKTLCLRSGNDMLHAYGSLTVSDTSKLQSNCADVY